jgi:hypothetical protein
VFVQTSHAQTNVTPRYTTLKSKRSDVGPVKRVTVWVSVPDGLTTSEVARVMATVISERTNMHAVSVFVMRDGEQPGVWSYTVGKCEWAPGSDWSKARDGLADSCGEKYGITSDFRPRYFSGVPRPSLYGLSPCEMAAIASECDEESTKESDVVFRLNPLPGRAERNAAEEKAVARVAQRHRLRIEQVKEIWSAYTSDVIRCTSLD